MTLRQEEGHVGVSLTGVTLTGSEVWSEDAHIETRKSSKIIGMKCWRPCNRHSSMLASPQQPVLCSGAVHEQLLISFLAGVCALP